MVKFEDRAQRPTGGGKPVLQRIGAFVVETQLEQICSYLHCQSGDIMEYVEDEQEKPGV